MLDGFPMETEVASQVAGVKELGRAVGKKFEELRDLGGVVNPRDLPHVAFYEDATILPMPLPSALRRSGQRLGIAAGDEAGREGGRVFDTLALDFGLEVTRQEGSEEGSGLPFLLRFREWLKLEDLHPTRQRVANLRQQQEVGRPREEESPGTAFAVHGGFERAKQNGSSLNFIDDDGIRQRGDEAVGVAPGGGKERCVIEAHIGQFGPEHADEGAFSALTGAEEADHRRVFESRSERRFQRPGIELSGSVHLPVL